MSALSPVRKFLTAFLTAALVFLTAVNMPGADVPEAVVTFVPALIGAVVLYFTANTPDLPSSKFLVALGAALATLVVYLVQHGTDDWRQALVTSATAVVGAVLTYLMPNAGQVWPDAAADPRPHPDAR